MVFSAYKVAGIEFKANFQNFEIPSFVYHSNKKIRADLCVSGENGKYLVDITPFLKPDIKIPFNPNIALKSYSNNGVNNIQTISISKPKNGIVYDYFNIYGYLSRKTFLLTAQKKGLMVFFATYHWQKLSFRMRG